MYDHAQKRRKPFYRLLGLRNITSVFSVRSGDSGYASSRASLAPSSISSFAKTYSWDQPSVSDQQHPHMGSLSEFNGLYRVPCPILHEPQSIVACRDLPTCQHCMYSGIHNLSWSSRYLKSEVFMSELKLVGVYDVGAADAAGNSALHYAAAGGASFQTLTALVQAGTNPYQLNTAGQLFLHCLQPQFVDFFPTPYDKDQVSRFQEDLVNLFHTFHSKGAFR
jgi:hypothetical protein